MKAFKEWRTSFHRKKQPSYEDAWKAALEWVSKGCEKKDNDYCMDCLCFDAVINFIDEELEETE